MTTNSEGIMIFKDTLEYLMDDYLTAEQFAELMKLIYQTRWGDGVDEKSIADKEVRLVWKTLKHSVLKSARNARHHNKGKNNSDIQPNDEFEIEANKTTNQIIQANPQPIKESVSKGQEIGKNDRMNHQQLTDHLANLTETWDKTRRQVS